MTAESEKFYGHPLVGVWIVPSNGYRILPSKLDVLAGITWAEDDQLKQSPHFTLWPSLGGERLTYEEEG